MSAIVGIYYLDSRPVERTDLEEMVATLAHRGPDGAGAWNEGPVGLGQRMLWTTPESLHEQLPLVHPSGNLVLAADARIDNRGELISALALEDRRPDQITDGELILYAYEKWGERCPERLLGDFAFAIWDGSRQILFCAKDPMGVKPFYYHRTDRVFVFGSEIKALFCIPEVPRRLDETRVADYLTAQFEDNVITLYQGISRLPAAHSMTVGSERIQTRRYWSPDLSYQLRLVSDDEYAEAFREVFTEAVRCRLRTAYPVGSMLSGGLDSSSIVCTAARVLAESEEHRLHTFSAIFPTLAESNPRIDERPYIEAVLAAGDFEPHYVHADRLSPLAEYDAVIWHADEAVPAPNGYIDWALFRTAHQHGVRVLLTGIDGDSAVSHGFESLQEFARTGRWRALIAEATALSRVSNAVVSPWQIIWRYGFRPLVPDPAVQVWRVLHGCPRHIPAVNMAINRAFAQRIGLSRRVRALQSHRLVRAPSATEAHWLSLTAGMFSYGLELYDKVAAAFSCEARHPFFDRRLIEFCLAVPATQKLRHGWPRAILRNAMDGILPHKVQYRYSKGNLSSNFELRLFDRDRDILDGVILQEPQMIEKYIDMSFLRDAYFRYKEQPRRNGRDALVVFLAATLGVWLRRSGLGLGTDSSLV